MSRKLFCDQCRAIRIHSGVGIRQSIGDSHRPSVCLADKIDIDPKQCNQICRLVVFSSGPSVSAEVVYVSIVDIVDLVKMLLGVKGAAPVCEVYKSTAVELIFLAVFILPPA